MRKRVLIVPSMIVAAGAWWLLGRDDPKPAPTVKPVAVSAPPVQHSTALAQVPSAPAPAGTPVEKITEELKSKLDPKSDVFRERIDEIYQSKMYAEAAKCYRPGLVKDTHLDMTYHLTVSDGNVTVGNFKISDNTLNDRALEACIMEKVQAAHWHDPEMPDSDSEEDLLISVRGFKKYLASADDDSPSNPAN